MKNSIAVSRAGMFVALTVLFFLLWKIPVVSLLMSFLLPLPLTLLGIQHGPRYALLSVLGVAVLIGLFSGPVSIFLYLQFAVCSVVAGLGIHFQISIRRLLWLGAALISLAIYADFYVGAWVAGISTELEIKRISTEMQDSIAKVFVNPLQEQRQILAVEYQGLLESNRAPVAELDSKKTALDQAIRKENMALKTMEQMGVLMDSPMLFLFFPFVFVYFLSFMYITRYFVERFRVVSMDKVDFSDWKCPVGLSWLFILSMLIGFYFEHIGYENGTKFIVGFGYSLQMMFFLFGLSFVGYVVLRFRLSAPLKLVIFLFGCLFANQLLVLTGALDSFLNLRHFGFKRGRELEA